MNPNNAPTPLDYLNEIAPATPKRGLFQFTLRNVIIFASAAILLVIILAVVVGAINQSRKTPWETLSVRLGTTATIANDATKNLKNSQLRSLNSDLKLYLTNTIRDLDAPLGRSGVATKNISASITKKESGEAITTRLEDARLNAKYDSTYAREMSYLLATVLSLYQELYAQSGNAETKSFLSGAYDNLLPTQEAFESFSTTNE